MAVKDAPTSEIGALRDTPLHLPGVLRPGSWGSFHDDVEQNVKLKWPGSVPIYDEMLNDGQIEALADSIRLPLYRRRWMLDRNGARPTVVKGLAGDLGLPIKGDPEKPRGRVGGRFSWRAHLEHVLDAPFLGHYYFEQVGEIGPDGLWHLRKLAPRPPQSILELSVAQDGGLEWIRQKFATGRRDNAGMPPPIPVDRLVAYVWGKRAGNWVGRSMLRSIYKHWLSKDILIRTDVTKHQRNGMGVPTAKATDKSVEPQQLADAHKVAQAWRAGQDASAALPFGTDIELKGVTGTLPDTLASIRYHDEQMARRFLAMFLQLGQTETGSRALGESFIDFFALSLDAVAGWVCEITNEHVIEDWVDWNYGPDEQAPLLVSERDEEPELTITDFIAMVDGGVITIDDELEVWARDRYQLPKREPGAQARPAPTAPEPAPAARATRRQASAAVTVPDRDLRREPNTAETAAGVDFAVLDQTHSDAVAALVEAWQEIRAEQIDELASQAAAADDLSALTQISATVRGLEVLRETLVSVSALSVEQALEEAAQQGADLDTPDMDGLAAEIEARADATASLLAQALSDAARRRAVALAGPDTPAQNVADGVREHLEGLTDAFLEEQFTGAVTEAQNGGRRVVFEQAENSDTAILIYASALLDPATCDPCREDDGKEYASAAEFAVDFPTGGNRRCQGGRRCRCTGVAVYAEAAPSVQ